VATSTGMAECPTVEATAQSGTAVRHRSNASQRSASSPQSA
jgi:hypothetical protein